MNVVYKSYCREPNQTANAGHFFLDSFYLSVNRIIRELSKLNQILSFNTIYNQMEFKTLHTKRR